MKKRKKFSQIFVSIEIFFNFAVDMTVKRVQFIRLVLLLAALLLAFPFRADAQRTGTFQWFADVQGEWSMTSFGARLAAGQYTYGGLWTAGVSGVNRRALLVNAGGESFNLDYAHLEAEGTYLWRLLSSRDRSVCLYGGAGVFMGAEFADPFGRRPNSGVLPFGTSFLYGAHPAVQFEWFLFERVALLASFRMPVCVSSKVGYVFYEAGLGLRFNF